MTDQGLDTPLYFNGIDGDTGDSQLPPMTAAQLSAFILRVSPAVEALKGLGKQG